MRTRACDLIAAGSAAGGTPFRLTGLAAGLGYPAADQFRATGTSAQDGMGMSSPEGSRRFIRRGPMEGTAC